MILFISSVFTQSGENNTPEIVKLGDDWYQATSFVEFHEDITKAQAKENATKSALKKIIEYYSGIDMSSTSLLIVAETNLQMDIDHFSQLTNTMSSGIILEKEVLEDEIKTIFGNEVYEVKLKAKVGKLEGESDPFFKLEANLNRDHYQDGDEMIINVTSSKNCFVYVFNILSDETVSTLLPNQYLEDNFLAKGQSLRVPPEKGKITKFRVDLPEGKIQATELIMVLGIKAGEDTGKKDFDLNLGEYKMAMKELMEFILGFPRNRVEQVNLPYVIKNKE